MNATRTDQRATISSMRATAQTPKVTLPPLRKTAVPVTRSLSLAYAGSAIIAVLIIIVSVWGLAFGPSAVYALDRQGTSGIATSSAGIIVPGFRAHDLFNLVIALPVLVTTLELARRGSLKGLLLWPGALVYVLYTYTSYLVGAPFGPLFLAYVVLVVVAAYATAHVVVSIDSRVVRERLAGAVPARSIGGLLVVLALATLAQDASGAVSAALDGLGAVEPIARHVWTADLVIEVPAMIIGGVLLWRRTALGYAVGAALLLQFGLTPLALAVITILQPWLNRSFADLGLATGLMVFAVVGFAPLTFFLRGWTPPVLGRE